MVSQGIGASWPAALKERGLLRTSYAHTGLVDRRSRRPIMSLMVRLTTDGRKVARLILGEPLIKPRDRIAKPLSLSALRLIAYSQQHQARPPGGNWRMATVLFAGDSPTRLKITEAGLALDVTQEPNWKPFARPIGLPYSP